LPVGVLLVLEVGDKELFHSRPIAGAPALGVRPNMQLLDGQQRMTSLWRALNDDYEDQKAFVRLPLDGDLSTADADEPTPAVEIVRRWDRKGARQPVWADDPVQALARGLIPLSIFRPGAKGEDNLKRWREKLREAKVYTDAVGDVASELRRRLLSYQLPFLSLPPGTSRETALEVFINMNTSASPLTDYDIVVAQVEEGTGESLHEKVESLVRSAPAARDYGRIQDTLLSVAALLSDRPPLKKSYLEPDFGKHLAAVWPQVVAGVERGLQFLNDEGLLNDDTLPSEPAVYLTCALWSVAADHKLDREGNARSLIRKVLWRACWTDRYGKTSATRAHTDFKVLRRWLLEDITEPPCELFNEEAVKLPAIEEIKLAGWPKRKDRLPRAILATTLRRRAQDFADGTPVNRDNIKHRELDHLYSVKFLGVDREDSRASRALNCALITWATNRNKSKQPPSDFIARRAEAANLGAETVKWRLATHLIPYEALIGDDYDAFLEARAKLIEADMRMLCEGREPTA
jgi:hypothetical protein